MASADLTLAHYAAPELLACGPRAATFQARTCQSGELIVVHVLQPEFNPAPAVFLNTLRTAAHLRHPSLVPILDFGHADGRGFWVTPYYPAGSLRRRLAATGPVEAAAAASWLAGAAEAVAYLHRRGLVHAGLTPRRLLLATGPAGRVLVDGAGLAPLWSAPDDPGPTEADDLRALGTLLAEVITGQQLPEALGALPEPWAALVRSATASAPSERCPGAAAFASGLHAAREAGLSTADREPPTSEAEPALADTGPLPPIAPDEHHPAALETPAWFEVRQPGQRLRRFSMTSGAVTLGRDPACDIVLDQPEVSRRHLRLSVEAGQTAANPAEIHLTDLGSVNGTYVDGQRLPPHMPQAWPPGASITVGTSVLRQRGEASPPMETASEAAASAPAPRRRYQTTGTTPAAVAAPRAGRGRANPARALTVLSSVGLVIGALAVAAAWPEMSGLLALPDHPAQAAQTATAAWLGADDDRDGLANALELTFGSLPLVPDSDGDGLTDGNEVRRNLNPADPDSDRDRTPDPMDLAAGLAPSATALPSATPTLGPVSVTGLEPASVVAGESSFQLTVRGAGFVEGAVVRWNGLDRPATVLDAQTLTTVIAAGDIAVAGVVSVRVRVPGAVESGAHEFIVDNPVPVLYAGGLDPAAVEAGGPPFTLVLNGAGFVNGAVVRWNGLDRPTVYRGPGEVLAFIDAADIAQPGTGSVLVYNPAPGGGPSGAQAVAIEAAAPTLAGLSPSVAVAGGPALTLTVTGAHLQSGAVLRWNGTDRPTTFISSTQLTVSVPASDLAVTGSAMLAIVDPRTGALSNALRFNIINPAPALAALSPATAPAGSPGIALTVAGTGFAPGAVVLWNGAPRSTTFLNPTQLTVTLPAADLASPGSAVIGAANPGPGGGASQTTLVFTVAAP